VAAVWEVWVVPVDGAWVVRVAGEELEQHDTKTAAVARAMGLARNRAPSEVVVLGTRGNVEERRTFDT
jgi:hypothetical protein